MTRIYTVRQIGAQPDLCAELATALHWMVDSYGPYAGTPKANRCYPTRREVNSYQRQAMDKARAALTRVDTKVETAGEAA